MNKNKWIYDIQADELINLKDCQGFWKKNEISFEKIKGSEAKQEVVHYQIMFSVKHAKENYVLNYETQELRDNAFLHYKIQLEASEVDASHKLLTL